MTGSETAADGGRPATVPPPGRRWRWFALAAAILLPALLVWAVASEAGLRALLGLAGRLTGGQLEVQAPQGRLMGPLRLGSIAYVSPTLDLRVDALELDWRPAELLHGRLSVDYLTVERIGIRQADTAPDPAPIEPPGQLTLPLQLDVARLTLGSFELKQGEAVEPVFSFSALQAVLASDGQHHRVQALQAALPFGALAFEGEIAAAAPFALAAQATLTGRQAGQDFRVDARASGDLLAPVLSAQISGNGVTGEAYVEAAPFAPVPLRSLRIAAGEIDPARFAAGLPGAALRVEADLAGRDGADGMGVGGTFSIRNLRPGTLDGAGLPIESVAGQLAWSPRGLSIDGLALRLAGGGRIDGQASWSPAAGRVAGGGAGGAAGSLQAQLQVAAVDTRRLDRRLPAQRLDGRIDVTVDDVRQTMAVVLTAGKARIDARGERTAETGAARFSVAAKLRDVDPRALYPQAPHARLNLDVEAAGSLAATTAVDARFELPEGRFEDRPLRGQGRFRMTMDAAGARFEEVDLALDVAGNQLEAHGAWGALRDRLGFVLRAPALGALGLGLGGSLGAEGEVGGGAAAPSGRLQFYAAQLRLPGGVRVDGLNGSGSLAPGERGALALAVGVSGVGRSGERNNWVDSAHLGAEGRRDAHRIGLEVAGLDEHHLALALEGGLRPGGAAWQWGGMLRSLRTEGALALRLRAPAALSMSPTAVSLASAVFEAGEEGRLQLDETRWSPAASVFRGSLTGLSFGLVRRADGRPRRGPGPLVLGANWDVRMADTVEGEARVFREAGDLTVSGELPTRLGLDALEARLVARANRLSASLAASGKELGELSGSATAALVRTAEGGWQLAQDAPLLGSARLDMPSVAWLGRLLRENIETEGRLEGEFTLAGTPAAPQASGRIRGDALGLALVDQGLVLSGGELRADFDRDRLNVERLAFVSPNRVKPREGRIPLAALTATPGMLTANGQIALDSGEGRFDFAADRLPLLQRADRWLILSGRGHARSTWTSLALDADLRADAGYVEIAEVLPPSLSDDVVVLGREVEPGGGLAITSDVRVALGDALYLSALGVETRLAGTLHLRQQPGRPLAATGAVSTVGGSYKGYGQRLVIERGLVSFQGPLDDPGLNIVALRKGLAVEAGVAIAGSARRPQVRLVSEPSVPDPEKLSWIVLGRAPDASGGADLALLLPAAQALLGAPGGGMTEQLSRSLGFDAFSIGQGELNSTTRNTTSRVAGSGTSIASNPTVAGQVLSVGKRLSSDLFLSFEQSLGGAESLVKLTYQLGRRVSLVARGGTDNALDLYYTFAFR